jgi:hypothetical protein
VACRDFAFLLVNLFPGSKLKRVVFCILTCI